MKQAIDIARAIHDFAVGLMYTTTIIGVGFIGGVLACLTATTRSKPSSDYKTHKTRYYEEL